MASALNSDIPWPAGLALVARKVLGLDLGLDGHGLGLDGHGLGIDGQGLGLDTSGLDSISDYYYSAIPPQTEAKQ